MKGLTHSYPTRSLKPPSHEMRKPRGTHGYSLQSAPSQSSGGPDPIPDNSNLASTDYRIDPPSQTIDERQSEFSITAYGNRPAGYDLQGEGGPEIHDTWDTGTPTQGRITRNQDDRSGPENLPSRATKDSPTKEIGFRFRQTFKGV